MGNCHVQFKGEGKEAILVEPVADISSTPIIRHIFMSATGSKSKSKLVLTTPHSKNIGRSVNSFMSATGSTREELQSPRFQKGQVSRKTKVEMPYLWR